ncbi:MAG: hypothetical protein MZW92_53445 [Comamonadaceae bacterium]|nr:hypothetical protein [Comamonadaceae bacterium]
MTPSRVLKTRLAVVAALLAALFVGRLWGASGRRGLDRALQAAVLRGDLLEAHAALLGARVSLCNADFGEVSQRLDHARVFVGRAGARLGDAGVSDEFLRLDLAGFGAGIDEARQLAARLRQGADRAAGVQAPVLPVKISEKP